MPVGTTKLEQADLSKAETTTEAPMTQRGRAAAQTVWWPCWEFVRVLSGGVREKAPQLMPVGTAQFGQANLSKTEAHTETPMTQLGRAAASSSTVVMLGLFCFLILVLTDASRCHPNRAG